MIRGDRLVIPMDHHCTSCYSYSTNWDGHSYGADSVPRIELSVEECEAIIINMPSIIEFVIRERPKKEAKK